MGVDAMAIRETGWPLAYLCVLRQMAINCCPLNAVQQIMDERCQDGLAAGARDPYT